MSYIIDVVFKNSPKLHKYSTSIEEVNVNTAVVVESSRGVTVGTVKNRRRLNKDDQLPEIIRVATDKDLDFHITTENLEEEAYHFCLKRIEARGLKMKIVQVSYMLYATKIIFYFTAEGRVDFRALVKDLASKFHSRIEMRQIGVRDEAQMVGGIGICGRELCCHTFIGDFHPVSLEDARESSFGVSNEKLIGVCGRFMCCLRFEKGVGDKSCENCKKTAYKDSEPYIKEEENPIKIAEKVVVKLNSKDKNSSREGDKEQTNYKKNSYKKSYKSRKKYKNTKKESKKRKG